MTTEPLSNDEVIARLSAAGVRATACLECGKVKEVRDDRVVVHYADAPRICPGSNRDLLGDVEAAFLRLTADLDGPHTPDDFGAVAAEEATDTLSLLLAQVEEAAGPVPGPSGADFCGCVPCIVRETLYAAWGYATHAQFVATTEWLMTEASREGMTKTERAVAQELAERLIAEHEHPEA